MTEFQIRIRSYIFRGAAIFAFLVLIIQLWNLQILQGEIYQELADANRFRLVQVPAARGVIYDRNDELLVRNQPTYNVIIIPAFLPDDATAQTRIFTRLSELLHLPVTTQVEPIASRNNGYFHAIIHHQYNRQLQRQIINPRSRQFKNEPKGIRDAVNETAGYAPFLPVTIATEVDALTIAELEEELINLPGVQIETIPSRNYIYKEATSHILGYVGPIPAEQFDEYEEEGYDITDIVGVAGLEQEYENWLRGIKGLENIEVDVNGQKIRTISENIIARPGHNLKLTLDIGLQKATEEALEEQLEEAEAQQGVAIAMNPQNGEILAMVSMPSFDNNIFSRGVTPRELALLREDPWTPLINHAISGLYPPGSTFKIIPAAGALQERVVTTQTTFFDEGILYLPNRFEPDNLDLAQPFYCWLRTGHGEVDIYAAIANSCDVYFYQVGGGYEPNEYEGLGLTRLTQYMDMFGLGAQTGIDLPGEVAGLVPSRKWKRLNYAETWVTGDTYNMSIGQGFVLSTPLQVLNATAAIANGGTLYRPYIVQEVLDAEGNLINRNEPQIIRQLDIDPHYIRIIQAGLRAVIDWDTGTAHDEFDVPGIMASGKTGTAEYCDRYPQCLDRDGRVKTSHAWFTSYAPSYHPEIVTVVFVYGGGEGSVTAVPVTNKMLRHYFDIQDETEEDAEEGTEEDEETPQNLIDRFQVRLLGTMEHWDSSDSHLASISGFILDENEEELSDITIEVSTNGQVVEQIVSDPRGQFSYNLIDPDLASTWEIRLPNYPNTPVLKLDVVEGARYLIEFKAEIGEELSSVE